ncbi:MAG: hypothetical protein F4X76_11765 [Chloroflexi bacterium]|nr:hypothetical protein [Chloroflexota bacterium]
MCCSLQRSPSAPARPRGPAPPPPPGQDLLDRLSEEENACIKAAFGDAVYEFLRGTPLLSATGSGGDSSAAAPLFACLTKENAVLAGAAFLIAAGGYSDESRVCITDLALRHPEVIYARLGLGGTGEQQTAGEESLTAILGFYDCLTDAEQAVWLIGIFTAIDTLSPLTGADLIALLPESQATCVRETLSGEAYAAMEAATPLVATGIGFDAAGCLTVESAATFLVASTEALLGPLSDESAACAGGFVEARPTYVPVIARHLNDPSALSQDEFVQAAEGGFELFGCLNDDELAAIGGLIEALGSY